MATPEGEQRGRHADVPLRAGSGLSSEANGEREIPDVGRCSPSCGPLSRQRTEVLSTLQPLRPRPLRVALALNTF